ncbi:MAG: TerB family tellurite resistance protein [Lentisphaeraceae bacterium]|nr:TerB family tellurite resistance protein [Lentisphaeraceae bacterium]
MPEITYSNIQANLVNSDVSGRRVSCTFKCPVNGKTVNSSASVAVDRGLMATAKSSATRSIGWSIRSAISRTVRNVLGYGIASKVAGDVVNEGTRDLGRTDNSTLSEREKEKGIVEAFQSVASQFVWNDESQQWISSAAAGQELPEFLRLLNEKPVNGKYEQSVLARMVVEIAAADGSIEDSEREFIADFIPDGAGSVDDLAAKSKLSPVELGEVDNSSESMLMIAWAVALTDEELESAEEARLNEFAAGLNISESRANEVKAIAQQFIFEQALDKAFSSDGNADSLKDIAGKIGIDSDDAERFQIRYKKRKGLI